jgi:hypothetical protein
MAIQALTRIYMISVDLNRDEDAASNREGDRAHPGLIIVL